MKKLVLLLMTLLVLSTLVSSPVLASRASLSEYRVHSMFGFLYRSLFLFRGVVIVPEEIVPIGNGGGAGSILGGDADDYGNGRWSDVDETKPVNKNLAGGLLGPSSPGPGTIKSVE